MGWKSTVIIHLGFWFYLVGGGAVYYYIEDPSYHLPPQPKPMTINATFCQNLVNSVENYITNIALSVPLESKYSAVWNKVVRDSCNDLTNSGKSEENGSQDVAWEFSSALFLCMTILTTIGYGNFSPKSSGGKIFCIFYGLIGIPICGVFLATTSDYFSNSFLHLYERRRHKLPKDKWHGIFIAAVIFLLPGLAVFLFIPAAIFTYLEDWSYLDATYFSFMTLTTIGFGDIVVAQETNYPQLWLYRIGWIVWVMLGIAYWAIIISFITKALRSKKLRQKWAETSHALSIQAHEMRRAVKQLSTNDLNGNAFIALKSKAAFDFALQLTGSMGNVRAELDRQPLPGIATAFKPTGTAGRGLLALMEMSVKTLGHIKEQRKLSFNESAPVAVLAEEEVQTSPQINIYSRQTLINSQSSGMDSGFDDDDVSTSRRATPCHSRQLSKTNSDISVYKTEKAKRNENSKWNCMSRSQTQPELERQTSFTERQPELRDLLMEAILIIEEAEMKGTPLNQLQA